MQIRIAADSTLRSSGSSTKSMTRNSQKDPHIDPDEAEHPDPVPGGIAGPGGNDPHDRAGVDEGGHRIEAVLGQQAAIFGHRAVLRRQPDGADDADGQEAERDPAEKPVRRPAFAIAGLEQLDMHQHEDQRVEHDVAIEKRRAERRAVRETVIERGAPGRVVHEALLPDRAGIVGTGGHRGRTGGRVEADIDQDVIDADEGGDRGGDAFDDVSDIQVEHQPDAEQQKQPERALAHTADQQDRPDGERRINRQNADRQSHGCLPEDFFLVRCLRRDPKDACCAQPKPKRKYRQIARATVRA